MTKAELVKYLGDFSDDAEVVICVNNYPAEYEILFGGSEGCSKATADTISFHVGQSSEHWPVASQ